MFMYNNYVICGNFDEETKFQYIRKHICTKYENVHYVNLNANEEIITEWNNKIYLPDNLITLNPKSSMLMEGFTTGHEENGMWITSEENYGHALILEGHPNKLIVIEKVREGMWGAKPLYIFMNISLTKAKKEYKDIAEIIRLNKEV